MYIVHVCFYTFKLIKNYTAQRHATLYIPFAYVFVRKKTFFYVTVLDIDN